MIGRFKPNVKEIIKKRKNMADYVISLDLGTTSVRTLVVDANSEVVAVSQKEYENKFPQAGWVEQDAKEIWECHYATFKDAVAQAGISISDIKGIGITNQRETVVVWDKETGEPVYNAIVWQDKRTADYCADLKKDQAKADMVKAKTGLLLDPYFTATKLRWILENVEGVREQAEAGKLIAGTLDTWLVWQLTKGASFYTDQTNASRTLLYDINTLSWDDELLELFEIPKGLLPEVINSADDYGKSVVEGLEGIPITAVIGDQQSSLYGHRRRQGELKSTYGTGGFLVMNTGDKAIQSKNGLLTTIAVGIGGKVEYALEGSIYIAGSVLKWLLEEMKLIESYPEVDKYVLDGGNDTNGVCVVPYFVGVGAPYWNPKVRGMITGLTRGANNTHIIKATAQSIVLQTKDIISAFEEDYGQKIEAVSIDGGVAQGEPLMQFLADMIDVKLYYPKSKEVTALGAAYLAGLYSGVWASEEALDELLEFKKIYEPSMAEDERNEIYGRWQKAVKAALALEVE